MNRDQILIGIKKSDSHTVARHRVLRYIVMHLVFLKIGVSAH